MEKELTFRDVFVFTMKYIPIIQMVGMIVNNTLYYFEVCTFICILLDFLLGNSLLMCAVLMVCNYMFHFCNWHRLIILSNVTTAIIVFTDRVIGSPLSDLKLLTLYLTIYLIFIVIIIINRFRRR